MHQGPETSYLPTHSISSLVMVSILWRVRALSSCIVPCLRRATAINYTDADEDAEKLMSFLDEVSYTTPLPGLAEILGRRSSWT